MFVRAYLRASTAEQDASRAKEELSDFAKLSGHKIAAFYVENVSGASVSRPELNRLLEDAQDGDILLLEQVDRLTRLSEQDWKTLKNRIESRGLSIVSVDLPTSHIDRNNERTQSDFLKSILTAINNMMIDMLAAVARKDYQDRRKRQVQGIKKARVEGKYSGRPADVKRHNRVKDLRSKGFSINDCAEMSGYSRATVCRILKAEKEKVVESDSIDWVT